MVARSIPRPAPTTPAAHPRPPGRGRRPGRGPAGRRRGLMVFSSDNQYTIRPAAGTQLTVDLAKSSFTLPVVGGPSQLATATGNALTTGGVINSAW